MSLIIVLWLLTLGEGDHRTCRIPTVKLWPGIVAVVTVGVTHPAAIGAALIAAVPYLAAHALGQAGGGDVKLAFVLGGLLADPASATVVGLAQVVALAGFWTDHLARRPHGPALAGVAAVLVIGA